MPTLQEVFGIRKDPVLSYVERKGVDGVFGQALKTDKHIIVYGSSKQGKTALRQKHMPKGVVVVRCGPNQDSMAIYSSVLRQVGIQIETFETSTQETKQNAKAKVGLKAKVPFVGESDVGVGVGAEVGSQLTFHSVFIGSDLADPQAVSELLAKARFSNFVVLENFHYLSVETQKQLAFGLKTFHEVGIRFIVLGIWQEANLLLMHNGDLQDRVVEVPVEPWEKGDFERVIELGCGLLNIYLSNDIKESIIENAYGNIGMLQEFLQLICEFSGVEETQEIQRNINDMAVLDAVYARKLQDQRGHLLSALQHIAGRSRTDGEDPLILPYYLTKTILSMPIAELVQGVHRRELLQKLKDAHHRQDKETIRTGDVSHLMTRLASHQEDLHPPLLHYDSNQQRLKVVDTRQFFVLSRIDRGELFEEIPSPLNMNN